MNIAQEDDSSIFKLLKNLSLNLQVITLKCSRICLFIAFVFILLLLYKQIFLLLYFQCLEKEKKNQFKSLLSPWLLIFFTFFQPSLLFQPPSQLLVFDIFSNLLHVIPHPLSIKDLEYTLFLLFLI